MSASREVIADVNNIETGECCCRNCARAERFINDMFICEGWDSPIRGGDFCSFFIEDKKHDSDKDAR